METLVVSPPQIPAHQTTTYYKCGLCIGWMIAISMIILNILIILVLIELENLPIKDDFNQLGQSLENFLRNFTLTVTLKL